MPLDSEKLLQTIISFVQAETLEKRKSAVETHPELLGDEADSLIESLVQTAIAQEDESARRAFEFHHFLLRRCREAGVEQTFRELEVMHLINLGNGLRDRYQRTGLLDDLEEAIRVYKQAVASTPEGHPDLVGYLNNLGNRLREHYQRTGLLDDLEEAIKVYKQAMAATPEGHPNLAVYLTNLGAVLTDHYQRTGLLDDLEEAIRIFKQVVTATPKGHPNLALRLNSLGAGLSERYKSMGLFDDLEGAIRIFKQVVAATPEDHPNLAMYLNNLGAGLLDRYKRTGLIDDLEEAIRVYRQAVAATPKGHLDFARYLNNLGRGLTYSYQRTGLIDDLEEAIRVCKQAMADTPEDHPDLAIRLNSLGTGLTNRYQRKGLLDDLEEATRIYKQAVAVTPKGHPDLAGYLNNLGNVLTDRYKRKGLLDDLEEAIRVYRQAVATTSKGHPDLAMYLNNLGGGLTYSYQRTGLIDDLEEAIKVYRQAVEATPKGHTDLIMYLNNLGAGLSERYKSMGLFDDLEEAIRIFKQVVAATPEDHPNLAMYLNSLGVGLTDRYQRTGLLDDLEEAIRVCKQAVEATPKGHTDLAIRLNSLGIGLTNRYQRKGLLDDLEESIKVYRQAVEATPKGHTDLIMYLNNLGTGLKDRYVRKGLLDDLEEAIRVYRQAVAATPESHTDLAGGLNNLGTVLANRYQRTGLPDDLKEAKQSFRRACDLGLRLAPEESVRAGGNWQRWAFHRGAWVEVVEAYGFIRQGTEQRLSFQFSRSDKSFSLGPVQGLTAQVAYAHLQLEQPREAVEVLEQGQAQLLREALERQRRDLARLQELGFKHLYEQFTQAAGQYKSLLSLTNRETRHADWLEQVERALQDMNYSAEAIRKDAGRENPEYRFFLKSLPFEEIQKQANEVPLIYLAATSSDGMALVVNGISLEVIELPELRDTILRKNVLGSNDAPQLGGYLGAYEKWRNNSRDLSALAAWLAALEETTQWLWDKIMGKVLAHLEAKGIREAVLIPTGLLGLLPLHAAWTEDLSRPTGRRYALDDFTLTYAPSAHALYHARQWASRPAENLLAVENPDGTLHFTEPEVKSVLSHFPGKYNHLLRDQAIKKDVVHATEFSQVLHFSTHGLAGWQEAESSRLKLADGDLILTELFSLHLDNARLAVLSACETGVPGTELPDEVVSLPCAWMQAGVPGVIGSLWSVDDMSTAMLMARFYDLWRDDNLLPPEALRRAQIWLRDSTVEELKRQFKASMESKGLPMKAEAAKSFYEKIGWEDPKDRPFDHPFYWAAFGYTGL